MVKTLKEWKTKLSEKSGLTKKDSEAFYKAFSEILQEEMSQNESTEVTLPYIGKFKVTTQKNLVARNPQNMKEVVVPISKRITFKSFKSFKDKLL